MHCILWAGRGDKDQCCGCTGSMTFSGVAVFFASSLPSKVFGMCIRSRKRAHYESHGGHVCFGTEER